MVLHHRPFFQIHSCVLPQRMNHNDQIRLLLPGKLLQPDFPGLTGIKAVGHQSPVLIELRRLALIVQNQKCLLQLFSNSLNVNRKNQIRSVFRFHGSVNSQETGFETLSQLRKVFASACSIPEIPCSGEG